MTFVLYFVIQNERKALCISCEVKNLYATPLCGLCETFAPSLFSEVENEGGLH